VKAPVKVPSIEVLGQYVESVSDVQVCTDVSASVGVVPQIVEHEDCGDPCYTIEVRNFDLAADTAITITLSRDGVPQEPQTYDPAPVEHGQETGRKCIIGVGGPPKPCSARLTQPRSLTADAAKRKVGLTWKASVDTDDGDLSGYEVWRSTTGEEGSFAVVATVAETTHVDAQLERGTSYWYYVVAFDADGNFSPASEVRQVTTL